MRHLTKFVAFGPVAIADYSVRGWVAVLSRARSRRRVWRVMRGMRHPAGSKPAGNGVTGSAQSSTTRSLRSRLVAALKTMGLPACLMESKRLLRDVSEWSLRKTSKWPKRAEVTRNAGSQMKGTSATNRFAGENCRNGVGMERKTTVTMLIS